MSRTFYFGNVAKRKNSTLQGTITNAYNVLFKNPCSLDNPVLTLKHSGDFNYNAAKYTSGSQTYYYFVVDKKSLNNDLWEVSLELDALATHKTEVLATDAYVLYDSVSNTEIVDNRIPMKTTATVHANTSACPFVPDGGCYILSLTGIEDSTGVYKVSSGELAGLMDDLSNIWDNLFNYAGAPSKPSPPTYTSDYLQNLSSAFEYFCDMCSWSVEYFKQAVSSFFGSGHISENIRDCKYIPFNVGITGGAIPIYLGTFGTQSSFSKIITDTVHRTATVSIPWQVPAGDFRRRSPYSELYIYLPYIGMTKLSSECLANQSSITVAYTLSILDGSMICTVSSGSEILGQYSTNVSAAVPVGVSNVSPVKSAAALIGGVAAAVAGAPAAAGMAALQFGDSVTPNFTTIGGLDGVAAKATNQNITCYCVFHDTIVAPNTGIATIGAPTMKVKSLSSLTGYCQCMDGHVIVDADLPIMEKLDEFINSGFFIE